MYSLKNISKKALFSPWMQAYNYAENVQCCRCFSRNLEKIYRTANSNVCEAKASGVLTQCCSLTLHYWCYILTYAIHT